MNLKAKNKQDKVININDVFLDIFFISTKNKDFKKVINPV
jgi:hypothetical protein